MGKRLLPLVSESVTHAGFQPLPDGAEPFRPDRYLEAVGGDPVILGLFRQREGGRNERHLLVVNGSATESATAELRPSGAVSAVFEFEPDSGQLDPVAGGAVAASAGSMWTYRPEPPGCSYCAPTNGRSARRRPHPSVVAVQCHP